jgi:hypothetical protein
VSPFQQDGENDTSRYAVGPQAFEYIEMGMGSPGEAEKAMHGRTASLSTSVWVVTAIAFGTCQNKNTLIVTPHQRVESCEDQARRDFWTGMLLGVIAAAIHRLMIPRLYPFRARAILASPMLPTGQVQGF